MAIVKNDCYLSVYADPDQPGLNDLQQLLQPVAGKWYQFGLQLDMNSTVLHEIEHETEKTPDEHMEEVLKHCLNRTEPKLTWRKVVNAVRGIEEGQLADNMEKQYCEFTHYNILSPTFWSNHLIHIIHCSSHTS